MTSLLPAHLPRLYLTRSHLFYICPLLHVNLFYFSTSLVLCGFFLSSFWKKVRTFISLLVLSVMRHIVVLYDSIFEQFFFFIFRFNFFRGSWLFFSYLKNYFTCLSCLTVQWGQRSLCYISLIISCVCVAYETFPGCIRNGLIKKRLNPERQNMEADNDLLGKIIFETEIFVLFSQNLVTIVRKGT